jgi:hypothetical protein
MAPALLTAVDATSHVHLIIGSNPLAGARCTRSIEVGAKPILLAPEDSTLHYGLIKRIEAGEVKWLKRSFQEEDLRTLGRSDVDGFVDAVFVTTGGKHTSGRYLPQSWKNVSLTRHSHTDLESLPQTTYTSQCRRCPKSLFLHSVIHILRRSATNWCHDIRERMQAFCADTEGNRGITPATVG